MDGVATGRIKPDELPARLMELQQHALGLQATVHDLAEENRKLAAKVEELGRCADFGKDFVSEQGVYWREDAPYCPTCWEVDRKPVRLSGPTNMAIGAPGRMEWSCSRDKGIFLITRTKSLAVTSSSGG